MKYQTLILIYEMSFFPGVFEKVEKRVAGGEGRRLPLTGWYPKFGKAWEKRQVCNCIAPRELSASGLFWKPITRGNVRFSRKIAPREQPERKPGEEPQTVLCASRIAATSARTACVAVAASRCTPEFQSAFLLWPVICSQRYTRKCTNTLPETYSE